MKPEWHIDGWKNEEGKLLAYAWPGGYPIFYLDHWNETLCPDCAQKQLDEYANELLAMFIDWALNGDDGDYRGIPDARFLPQAGGIHYEGEPVTCHDCNCDIASAYGNPR